MASYITLKANKIVGIYRSDEGRGRGRPLTDRTTVGHDERGYKNIFNCQSLATWNRALNAPLVHEEETCPFSRSIVERG